MNQSNQSAEAMLPAAPLFASSWAALFRLIRDHLSGRGTRMPERCADERR